ncbi:MAG: glycine--tRNA ligase subunit beta [Nitrospirae bacterium]|nr:glycine--tRNA ligase subunit beta [Nitrospirota bacterium]MBF0541806.1 glycine--tRNA ligase subunit beta [Nitrospirota bacterium]
MNILLEIGTEEIPARFLPNTMESMRELAEKLLDQNAVDFEKIYTLATPQRLVIIIYGVAEHQKPRTITHFGPPKNAAYDKEGSPTKAAVSFANSKNIKINEIVVLKKEKSPGQFGEYIAAVINEKGLPTKEIISDIFNKLITSLQFPKTMRWNNYDVKFARPVRWILALCGSVPFNVEFGAVISNNFTFGHRFLSNQKIQINSPDDYISALRNAFVIVDPDERKQIIQEQISEIERELNALVVNDEGLLTTVSYILEYPTAVIAEFSVDFLRLPKELLISVMRDHQKYFALRNQNGTLINKCIVISNTLKENAKNVAKGAEKVLGARFDDARFYFEQDTNTPLLEKFDSLKSITFQEGLGSIYDKVQRLQEICRFLSISLFNEEISLLNRAVNLSKADLSTGVVKEFPELQGIMGSHYAQLDGESDEIVQAILEQYLPKPGEDILPKTKIGIILSLADKIDNIASSFGLGLIPTGSKDPFALRRQAIGIISIIRQRDFIINFTILFGTPLKLLKEKLPQCNISDVYEKIEFFLRQRLEAIFSSEGFSHDQIEAAMDNFMNLPISFIYHRLNAYRELREDSGYNEFLLAVKRVSNIIPKGFGGDFDCDKLVEMDEKNLYVMVKETEPRFLKLVESGNFKGAIDCLKELILYINKFFDSVLVMDKNMEVRDNRLGLLKYIHEVVKLAGNISSLIEK